MALRDETPEAKVRSKELAKVKTELAKEPLVTLTLGDEDGKDPIGGAHPGVIINGTKYGPGEITVPESIAREIQLIDKRFNRGMVQLLQRTPDNKVRKQMAASSPPVGRGGMVTDPDAAGMGS